MAWPSDSDSTPDDWCVVCSDDEDLPTTGVITAILCCCLLTGILESLINHVPFHLGSHGGQQEVT